MDTGDETETSTIAEEEIEVVTQKKTVQGTSKHNKPPGLNPGTSSRKTTFALKRPRTVNLDDDDEDESNSFLLSHPDFQKLVKDFASLKSQVMRRWDVDLLVSAGTKEDLDKIENEKNMNKIVFSGIEIHDLWAADLTWAIRLEKIKAAIADFIKIIDPEGTYDLGFIRHLNFKLKGSRQILEVTMADESQAKALRKAYGAKVKSWRENKDFPEAVKGMSIRPSLTLATRVRIAILHALAKEIKSAKEDTDAWVIQHLARPVLKLEITQNNDSKTITTMGFAQAIAYYNKELPHSNLSS